MVEATTTKINTSEIEDKIGYSFKNKLLLEQAFTRRSYSAEHINSTDNEVLEFIGDSVIGLVVVKHITTRYTWKSKSYEEKSKNSPSPEEHFLCELDEADLSKMKIELVQRSSLAASTERLGLEQHLLMGKSDILGNVQNQSSVKEDLMEAIIGAIALDSNWNMDLLEEMVATLIDIESILENGNSSEEDYEQSLSRWFEKNGKPLIFEKERSMCENLEYGVSVNLGIDMLNYDAYGYGKTEKGARRMASRRAMDVIRRTNDRKYAIIKAVGMPDLNRAVNQLQELYQKKLIPEPKYEFTKIGVTDSGNPRWQCICTIEGLVEDTGGYICDSKSEAKKHQAFEVINYLIGKDLKSLFIKYGEVISEIETRTEEE